MPTDPDDEDWYDDEDSDLDDATDPCPECGTEIYADLDHCPRCGHWLTDADHRATGTGSSQRPGVKIIAALLLALLVIWALASIL